MKLQISRIYLSGIGHSDARADPLTITLLDATGAHPEHSLLFLRNAGGKTSLVRELFSMLHPSIVERIGREETTGRSGNLTDYVLKNDIAHVVVEWRRVDEGRLFDDWTVLTGLAAEWRTDLPTRSISDLNRVWYSVAGHFNQASLERLSFFMEREGTRHRVRLRAFREQLTALARGRAAPAVEQFETQQRWVEHLDALGLDRVLLRYMGDMNHSEAGASAIARWRTEVDFIRFFVKTVIDPAEIESIQAEIAATSEKIRRLPDLERQLRFEQAVHAELVPLAESVSDLRQAEERQSEASAAASLLVSGFAARETRERERSEQAERSRDERTRERQQRAGNADRWDDVAREHQQIAATYALEEAGAAYAQAEQRDAEAEHDVNGWRLTEDAARRDIAAAELRVVEGLAAAERERLAPLERECDEAARALASALVATAAAAEVAAAESDARAASARRLAAAKRVEHDDALAESTRLATVASTDEVRLEGARAQRRRLVSTGFLKADEPADAALARETQREADARAQRATAESERTALATERADLERQRPVDAETRIALERRHSETVQALATAEEERAHLAAHPLVLDVGQEASAVDIETIGAAIADRLLARATENERRARDEDLATASDRRSLAGLTEQRLLPPSVEIERALDALARAGIAGARPAIRYAADAMNAAERAQAIVGHPALLAGIVLQRREDLPDAQRALEGAALTQSVPLVIGPSDELHAASGASSVGFVLSPADAAWDQDAAEAERARLAERISALDAEREQLLVDARAARELSGTILSHIERYPSGTLAAQRALCDGYAQEVGRLRALDEARTTRLHEITARDQELGRTIRQCHDTETDAARRRSALVELADTEAKVVGLEAQIAERRAEARAHQELAEAAALEEERARADGEGAQQEAHDGRRVAQELRLQVVQLPVEPDAVRPEPGDLSDLRARYESLDRNLQRSMSESEVLQQLDLCRRQLSNMDERIAREPAAVQVRARELLALAESATAEGRAAALRRARAARDEAARLLREAHAARDLAKKELREITDIIERSRRPARLSPQERPVDRLSAKLREADARKHSEEEKALAESAERERADAEQAHRDAVDIVRVLGGWIDQLSVTLGSVPIGLAEPAAGEREALDGIGRDMRDRLAAVTSARVAAQQTWRERDDGVVRVLARSEFAALAQGRNRLHETLRQQTAEERAGRVGELLIETQTLIRVVQSELAAAEKDLDLATTALAKTVGSALTAIRNAERSSRLPESLKGWANEPFVRIRSHAASAEDVKTRLRPFVTDTVSQANVPTGEELLVLALLRAVGSFSVEILKPNEAFEPVRVPITELASFSGGQRATAVIALMLMFSDLRRRSRAASRDASLGALILDNPLGNANAGFLLDVQLAVANAAGIQLIYLSGIQDLGAVRRFPNFVALSNSAAQKTGWRYIRADEELRRMLRPDDEGPGGALTATRVAVTARP